MVIPEHIIRRWWDGLDRSQGSVWSSAVEGLAWHELTNDQRAELRGIFHAAVKDLA